MACGVAKIKVDYMKPSHSNSSGVHDFPVPRPLCKWSRRNIGHCIERNKVYLVLNCGPSLSTPALWSVKVQSANVIGLYLVYNSVDPSLSGPSFSASLLYCWRDVSGGLESRLRTKRAAAFCTPCSGLMDDAESPVTTWDWEWMNENANV